MNTLSADLFWLMMLAMFTGLLWVPYVAQLVVQEGLIRGFTDPLHDLSSKAQWAKLAKRAHANAVENLVVFAPLVIIAHLAGTDPVFMGKAALIFFFIRFAHFIVYTLGMPTIRQLLFLAGVGVEISIVLKVLAMI